MKEQLSRYLGDTVHDIQMIHNGLLSQGYKIIGTNKIYFGRKVKDVGGYEYVGDDIRSFKISHYMYNNANGSIASYGVCTIDEEHFHIQDFQEGTSFDRSHYSEISMRQIATQLGTLHNQGKTTTQKFTQTKQQQLYKRGYREILTNHETFFSVYENYYQDAPQAGFAQQLSHDMLDIYFGYCNKGDSQRLTTLHGDFHDGNIFIADEVIHLFDYSRIPYGDPGIDVGTYLANLEIKALLGETDSSYPQIFLDAYKEITQDYAIEQYCHLSKLRVVYLLLSPLLQTYLQWTPEQIATVEQYQQRIIAHAL